MTAPIRYVQRVRKGETVHLYFRRGAYRFGPLRSPDGSEELRKEVESILSQLPVHVRDFNDDLWKHGPLHQKLANLKTNYGQFAADCFREAGGKCEACGVSHGSKKHQLEIHHIDGDRKNGDRVNLACLCSGCHKIIHGLLEGGDIAGTFRMFAKLYPSHPLTIPANRLQIRKSANDPRRAKLAEWVIPNGNDSLSY